MAQYLVTWTVTSRQTFSAFVDVSDGVDLTPADVPADRLPDWERENLSPPLPVTSRTVDAVQAVVPQ